MWCGALVGGVMTFGGGFAAAADEIPENDSPTDPASWLIPLPENGARGLSAAEAARELPGGLVVRALE